MCPDHDLISAYIDGEVPSPWRERLEEHIASCSDCAALAANYSALGERLRAESGADESAPLARGRERLDALLVAIPKTAPLPRAVGTDLKRPSSWAAWRRSISLPLPLAAAAALIVILLGGATTMLALKPERGTSIQAVASGELAPHQAQPASMDELLRYLNSSDGQVTLTINLPTGTTFGSAGKPVIMRSGQVLRGTTVGGRSP
jgi:anti-sigma factor RsiW